MDLICQGVDRCGVKCGCKGKCVKSYLKFFNFRVLVMIKIDESVMVVVFSIGESCGLLKVVKKFMVIGISVVL